MIRFGEDESHIETVVEKNGISYQIDMHLKKNSPKGIAINKMPIRKASELFGIVNLVFFLAGRSEHYQERAGREKKIHRSGAFAA